MRYLLLILFHCAASNTFGQIAPENQKFAVTRERIVDYFEGTWNGLNAISNYLGKEMQQYDYRKKNMQVYPACSSPKKFTDYVWELKQEFHPMERMYINVDRNETIAFVQDHIIIDGEKKGSFEIDENKRLLSLKIDEKQRPSFAIFKMEDRYYYRYHFNKTEQKLYLLPLDEKEGHDLISVEGCTLVFEILEQ